MTTEPEPFTPPECDLRGMPYMPFDLIRLFDSDLYALSTGDEFKAAFTLWGKSFYQIPAGSLPSDDRLLEHLSGSKRWKVVREMALRGWVKCSDGRLYHRTVAEKVKESWASRVARRDRTEAARAARHKDKSVSDLPPVPTVTPSVTETVTTSVTESKGTEQNGTEERKKERTPIPPNPEPSAAQPAGGRGVGGDGEFERFWSAYPRKVGKGAARKAWASATRKQPGQEIISAVSRAAFDARERFVPHPATWLNQERWLDEARDYDPVLRAAGLSDNGELLSAQHPNAWLQLTGGRA